jgi:hypothetical protein
MRLVLVLALAAYSAACSGHGAGASGPAWPRSAARDSDGGESLAPRAAARAVAAAVDDDRPAAERPTSERPAAAPAASASAPAPAAPAPTTDDTNLEEIVIEVDD